MCGPTLVCMHRDCARGGRDGQLREASRDGRQESLDNSPGQASRRVPGPVEALRRTLPTNRAWKDFLKTLSNEANNPELSKPPESHPQMTVPHLLALTQLTSSVFPSCPAEPGWKNSSFVTLIFVPEPPALIRGPQRYAAPQLCKYEK